MYSSSNKISEAMTNFVPKRSKNNKSKIFVFGKNKTKFYYGDSQSYRGEYLKSEHWKSLRDKKLLMNPVCENCGSKNKIEPHHLQYKNLYDVQISDLKSLCRGCHNKIHLNKQNPKGKVKIHKRKRFYFNNQTLNKIVRMSGLTKECVKNISKNL
jgi:hypothetical protein